MRKNSGFQARDSPLPKVTGTTPILTGTSYHWPLTNKKCGGGCSGKGVCVPNLNRCDCGPYTWGADCSVAVVHSDFGHGLGVCVHNDSHPWFCDRPACIHSGSETYTTFKGGPSYKCTGQPLDRCAHGCHGRGRCLRGTCMCYEGYVGADCGEVAQNTKCLNDCNGRGECHKGWCKCNPPYWGTDCARGGRLAAGRNGPKCKQRPCVYVYDLPPRMNVLALKAEYDWRVQVRGKKFDYRMPPTFHEALLGSTYRTTDPSEADLFYVPTWDWHGSWGNPEVYYRAHRYISTAYPYWNASGGADHLWAIARDAAACDTPWGSLLEELKTSIILSNWGGVTGLSGRIQERCFKPNWDVCVPGTTMDDVVARSPFWLDDAEIAKLHEKRTTQLYFSGALCWKTSTIARTDKQLKQKCDRSYNEPGFLSRYSFGLRYEIYVKHRNAKGFRIHASDYPPSLPPRSERKSLDEEILNAKYCLAPAGTGWGMRVYHVLALGCVPVLTQHDGEHPPVAQAFDPEGLDWAKFAVVVRRDQIDELPQLLETVDLKAKQAALKEVWYRLVWRGNLREPRRSKLPSPDAFEMTMQALQVRLREARRKQRRREERLG